MCSGLGATPCLAVHEHGCSPIRQNPGPRPAGLLGGWRPGCMSDHRGPWSPSQSLKYVAWCCLQRVHVAKWWDDQSSHHLQLAQAVRTKPVVAAHLHALRHGCAKRLRHQQREQPGKQCQTAKHQEGHKHLAGQRPKERSMRRTQQCLSHSRTNQESHSAGLADDRASTPPTLKQPPTPFHIGHQFSS